VKKINMKKYATNILWDTDGDKKLSASLPQEICIDDVCSIYEGTDEQDEIISDYITAETGFCHSGYNVIFKS